MIPRSPRRCPPRARRACRGPRTEPTIGPDQGQLRSQQVKCAGVRKRPGAIAPPCQTPPAVIRSTVIAVPHETTRPGRPAGHVPSAAEDGQGPVGTAGLGSFDVHGDRDVRRRAIPA